tara:strand:- start:521 stop:988 length:468 start_codon:yes stop_codon:yes gene_type:complete
MNKYQAIWLTGQPASGKTTLANMLVDYFQKNGKENDCFNIDGDDLRDLFQNKDYSRKGRFANIRLGMSIAAYLINKNKTPIISLVSPYIELREEFKEKYQVLEVYLHTTEIRGREDYFAKDYEIPTDPKTLRLDTGKSTIKECTNQIVNRYKQIK